jgi:hypothetical protein
VISEETEKRLLVLATALALAGLIMMNIWR